MKFVWKIYINNLKRLLLPYRKKKLQLLYTTPLLKKTDLFAVYSDNLAEIKFYFLGKLHVYVCLCVYIYIAPTVL